MNNNKKKSTERFIEDSTNVHGDRYDYSKVEYVKNSIKVCIVCPEHGEFWQIPKNHLKGCGCPICGLRLSRAGKITSHLNSRNWNFEQPEDHKLIPLTQGKFARVDNEDFDKVKGINWYYSGGYAMNDSLGGMHRVIMDAPDDMLVDHVIQENTLDNRKSNLRLATHTQNIANSRYHHDCSSMYKGVSWKKDKAKWVAQIYINKKQTNLGNFDCEIECAKAYDKKALEYRGEFAYLNFPELKEDYLKEIKYNKILGSLN